MVVNKLKSTLILRVFILFMLLNISACSVVDNFMDTKNRINYKNNRSVKALDFPPDLTAPEFDMAFSLPSSGVVSATSMVHSGDAYTVDGRTISVLPKNAAMRIVGQGNVRWLEVAAPAEALWPRIRDFWRSLGISVKRDEPKIGIMETDWAENRVGLPMDWFRKSLGKIFQNSYDAGTRDRFHIRVEKPKSNVTRIFLTHKGAENVVTDTVTGWELRPANHELEAEMLNRLKAFLQGDIGAAKGSISTDSLNQTTSIVNLVTQEGQPILQVNDNYKRAWVLTGIMLDRMGLVSEKRNQAAGIYEVKYQGNDEDKAKRGFFSRLLGGRKTLLVKGQAYQVHIQDAGKISVVRIMDDEGKPLNPRLAKIVLARLKKEFDR